MGDEVAGLGWDRSPHRPAAAWYAVLSAYVYVLAPLTHISACTCRQHALTCSEEDGTLVGRGTSKPGGQANSSTTAPEALPVAGIVAPATIPEQCTIVVPAADIESKTRPTEQAGICLLVHKQPPMLHMGTM